MRKLYLLSDEWNNDRNFVSSELELIKEYFEVTVVCNDNSKKDTISYPRDIKFLFYKRTNGFGVLIALIKCMVDGDFWKELHNLSNEKNKFKKISEIIRFYINADLFWNYFNTNCLTDKDTDAIVYSYWYFWKCFAVTKHREKYKNLKVITRVHGYDLYKEQIPTGYQPFKKIMDEKLDRVVFISEHGFGYYLSEFGIKKSKKHIISKLGTKNIISAHNLLNLLQKKTTDNYINIVSCSAMIELKRVDLIVKALSKIDDVNIRWTHFGDGPLFGRIRNFSEELLSKKANIEYYLPGRVENDFIHKYYESNWVDAFLMMSRSEGNPVSVIEAMSYGIPIISTNINNMYNLVSGNGILVNANPSAEEISKAIEGIGNMNEEGLYGLRNNSRKKWEQEFDEGDNNKRFVIGTLLKL